MSGAKKRLYTGAILVGIIATSYFGIGHWRGRIKADATATITKVYQTNFLDQGVRDRAAEPVLKSWDKAQRMGKVTSWQIESLSVQGLGRPSYAVVLVTRGGLRQEEHWAMNGEIIYQFGIVPDDSSL